MRSDAWPTIAGHRDRLLRIARRRCPTREDAEDIVSEAMLRCATFENLDPARVEQFLTAVTVRLCADHYRKAERRGRALVKLASDPETTPGPEEELLDGVDALVLEDLLASLPERQRAVLFDRAEGMSVTQIATRHELTYKATESALARARGAMRAALATALGGLVAVFRAIRGKRAAAVVALPAVTLMIAATVVRVPLDALQPEAVRPPEAPVFVDELPRRVQRVTFARPAAKPNVRTRTAPPAPVTAAAPVAKGGGERDVVNLNDYNQNAKGRVTTNPNRTPEEFVDDCLRYGPYAEMQYKPNGDPDTLYSGCGKESPLYEGGNQ